MKKILLISIMALSLEANALYFTIENQSFDEITATARGSQQYIDIKSFGSYLGSDSIEISITDNNNGNVIRVYTAVFYTTFPNLPTNSDGSSRVFFNMPTTYPDGIFKIKMIGYAIAEPKGFFVTTTSITNYQFNEIEKAPIYYNLNGNQIKPQVTGIYIRLVGTKREKVFLLVD